MKTVYFVLCDAINNDASWDTFSGAYLAHDEALAAARSEWNHLTDREQRQRVVTVNHAEVSDGTPLEDANDEILSRGDGWYVDEEFRYGC